MMMSGDRTETAGTLIRLPQIDVGSLALRNSERVQFFVAAIATRNGRPTVDRVLPGDRIVRIDGTEHRDGDLGRQLCGAARRPGRQARARPLPQRGSHRRRGSGHRVLIGVTSAGAMLRSL
jgi:hypothetical protein